MKNGRLYTGSTSDFERRFSEHCSGKSKYTKNVLPVKLVYKEEYSTRSEAYRREMFLKTGKGREFLSKILNTRG